MPSVSRAQQKAMHAAAAGHGKIGIPRQVAEGFVAADHERGRVKLPPKVSGGTHVPNLAHKLAYALMRKAKI
jgi:hypothetical protein